MTEESEKNTPIISIENATVKKAGMTVLDKISWQVSRGEKVFLLGANGAGKTTLVRLLLGYDWPLFGAKVQVFGETYGAGADLVSLRRRIAWLSPLMYRYFDFNITALELVVSALAGTIGVFHTAEASAVALAEKQLERFGCAKLRDRKLKHLSSGEILRLLIVRALLPETEMLILDEPCVYLDPGGREFALREVAKVSASRPDLTVLFISQRIEDLLPTFRRGAVLKKGRFLADGARDEILTEANLTVAFGVPLRLSRTSDGRYWSRIGEDLIL